MEKTNKVYILIAVLAVSLIGLGAALFYSVKNQAVTPEVTGGDVINNNIIQEPIAPLEGVLVEDAAKIEKEIQGIKVMSDENYPRGIIDGTVKEVNITEGYIIIEASVDKIYPGSPVLTKTVKVFVKNAPVTSYDADGNGQKASLDDAQTGGSINFGLVDTESNRDIVEKDEFHASRISVFR